MLPNPGGLDALPGTVHDVEATAADGTRIQSWLVLPEGASAESPAPLVLWIHGGPLMSWNSWSWRWCPWILAARGLCGPDARPRALPGIRPGVHAPRLG